MNPKSVISLQETEVVAGSPFGSSQSLFHNLCERSEGPAGIQVCTEAGIPVSLCDPSGKWVAALPQPGRQAEVSVEIPFSASFYLQGI